MKTKHLFITIFALIATMAMTSCLSDDDGKNNTYAFQNYFTIRGSYPNYKLYSDGGGIITPTASSVSSLTSSKGFGDYQRAFLYMTYTVGNTTQATDTSEATIDNADLVSGYLIDTRAILSKEKAELSHITDSDSLAYIQALSSAWVARGYLTVVITSYYVQDSTGVAIAPTTELVYDTASIGENQITMSICNVLHKTENCSTAGSSSFTTSYDIEELSTLVPGTGDITIKLVSGNGGASTSIVVPRSYLKFQ